MASFQEDGLVRQGVLETMEPLGTRPKPAVFKKLFGSSSPFHREGSAVAATAPAGQDGGALTPGARKSGAKRIVVLKRKNGNVETMAIVSDGNLSANGRPDASMSSTQSPTPSRALATPQLDPELQPAPPSPSTSSTTAPPADTGGPPGSIKERRSPKITASLTAKHQASVSIPPTSDSIQPTSEDSTPANHTPTSHLYRRAVSQGSPTPHLISHDSRSRPPSTPPLILPSVVPSIAQAVISPPSYASNPFLPDPIKQSIEGPHSLLTNPPTTPRSVASYNHVGDSTFFKREPSAQSAPLNDMARTRAGASQEASAHTAVFASASASADNGNGNGNGNGNDNGNDNGTGSGTDNRMKSPLVASSPQAQAQAPQQYGPFYTDAELARVVQPLQKEVVTKAIEHGVNECLAQFHYDKAYAYRQVYDEYQDNASFLLLAESIFRQTASNDAVFQWALLIQGKIAEGNRDNRAVKYFVPEASTNKDFVPHQPQPAPYRGLITLDLSRLQELAGDKDSCKKRSHEEYLEISDESVPESELQPQPQPQQEVQNQNRPEVQLKIAEIEPEPFATSPHPPKRPRLQSCEPSFPRSTGRKTASGGMNGKRNASLSRRKNSSGSTVSDSSLSSARSVTPPPPPTQQAGEDNQTQDAFGDLEVSSAAGLVNGGRPSPADAPNGNNNANAHEPDTAAQPQAMMRPRRAPVRRGRNANASQPDSHNNNQQQQDSSFTDVPAVNETPAPPPQQRSRNPRRGAPDFTPAQRLDENDELTRRRRAAKVLTISLTNKARSQVESDVRHEPRPGQPMREQSPQSDLSSVPEVEALEPPPPPAAAQSGRGARAARSHKRQHDQVDEDDETQASSPGFPPAEPSTGVTSRAATPARPAKRPRTGPRLKVSPMKNKAGTAAGNPRARSDRASPTANGLPNTQEDNDDFCSACGGNGQIVCCDGCKRAFHQLCHDPHIEYRFIHDEDSTWLCHDCMVKRNPDMVGNYAGPFGPLMTALDKKHAVSFRLPKKIRDYFEGVKTGVDGEYEDFVAQPRGAKKQKTAETVDFDYHQVMDKEENPVLCHACRKATREDRPMLPCSLCGLWWHTDCLDPPRAITPNPNLFKCPCHVEDLLKEAAPLGPAHKFRKIRGASELEYLFDRGNVNNGWIEVDDEREPPRYGGFRDYASYGRTYRLSTKGVQRDFFSKVWQTSRSVKKPVTKPRRIREAKSRADMRAALDLLWLSKNARGNLPSGLDPSQPIHGIAQSEHTVFINDKTVTSSSTEELNAMQKAAHEMNEKIQAEMKRRDTATDAENAAMKAGGSSDDQEQQQVGGGTAQPLKAVNAEPVPDTAANEGATAPAPTNDTADNSEDSTVAQIVSHIVETAVSSVCGKEATSATDTVPEVAANVDKKIDQEPATVESALTPVSEAPRDGEELSVAVDNADTAPPNGIETPETETNMPDGEDSVTPAGAMDLD